MMLYVLFGGMRATTWVQIIKAVLLLGGASFMALMVLAHMGFSLEALFARAVEVKTQAALADGATTAEAAEDRKSVVSGKGVSVSVDLGGRRILKKKNKKTYKHPT